MRLPFSGRNEKLETMNRILTEAAQKRTERIEELERRSAQLERELETAREAIERVKVLEVVAAERAQLLNEKDKQLAHLAEKVFKSGVFINTILEAQAILARHIAGEHASAEETIAKLMQLLDSTELVKALARRGFSSKALE
jgi:hypothetical protein